MIVLRRPGAAEIGEADAAMGPVSVIQRRMMLRERQVMWLLIRIMSPS